ncbi:hypothetical protein THAR02_03651 [Trichoderma harzianum]|uniref:Uncharacterized protein n=1 Tax=Trichoderma harzianum TaxID=5544 RepID=A0A0F9ZVY7_TRIHA|nr:hypothetical protein THAR02_03651 [Trichoderma harzianum]
MAPGYRSPFDHAPSPNPIHNTDVMPPALAIFLCASIIVGLTLFVFFCAANHHGNLQQRNDASVPAQEMVTDLSSTTKDLILRPSEDIQRAIHIRDESCFDDIQQPLLPAAGTYSNSLANDVEMATRRHDNAYRGPIHWHGINMLNTSWGWMA